ncbi:MAG: carboxypeptidase-like regulatory domain-containing protein [Bacteroidota bacterium]
MKKTAGIPIFIILLAGYSFFPGAGENIAETVKNRLENFTKHYSKEKIYVHTDKPMYEPGDIIWFSAYVCSANDLSQHGISEVLQIKLMDAKENTVNECSLVVNNGKARGDIKISENIPGGTYTLEASTRWQENFGSNYIFRKEITVYSQQVPDLLLRGNFEQKGYFNGDVVVLNAEAKFSDGKPIANSSFTYSVTANGSKKITESTAVTDAEGKAKIEFTLSADTTANTFTASLEFSEGDKKGTLVKTVPMAGKEIFMEFYPEGGDLIAGTENRVAFRAWDKNGEAANVSGVIKNKEGKAVSPFVVFHQGTGSFYFVPEKNEQYTAEITSPRWMKKEFKLRDVSENGIKITGIPNGKNNSLELNLFASVDEKTHLIAHHNGKVLYSESMYLRNGNTEKKIDVSGFPMGVTGFTLFDNSGTPVSERLFFLNTHKKIKITFETDKQEYKLREKVKMKIKATDENGKPVKGDFSVVVADDKWLTYADDKSGNIISSMLLQADLEGDIDEPGFYLDEKNPKSGMALDLLMLTRGWRTFKWKTIFSPFEKTDYWADKKTVSGILYDFETDEPAANMGFTIKETGKRYSTDKSGKFFLENIDLSSSKTMIIRQKKKELHYTLSHYDNDLHIYYPGKGRAEINYVDAPVGPNEIGGRVYDENTMEPLPFVTIFIKNTKTACVTDIDGNYKLPKLAAGEYTLVAKFIGYKEMEIKVHISEGKAAKIDIRMAVETLVLSEMVIAQDNSSRKRKKKKEKEEEFTDVSDDIQLNEFVVVDYVVPLIDKDELGATVTVTRNDITHLPTRSVSSMVETVVGVIDYNETDQLQIRGSRSDANLYYIDGVKVNAGSINLPKSAINQITVYTGGIPANYGDVTGGVVVITTRNYQSNDNYNKGYYSSQPDNNVKRITQPSGQKYYLAREFPIVVHKSTERYEGFADDRTTLYWDASLNTNDKGEAEIEFYTTDEITSFRTTVEGIGLNGYLAHGEHTFASVPELAIESFIPEKLVTGDTISLSATIINRTLKEKNGKIKLFLPEGWKLISSDSVQQKIAAGETQPFHFSCSVGATIRKEQLRVEFDHGKKSENTVLNTEVLPYGYPVTQSFSSGQQNQEFIFELKNSDPRFSKGNITIYPSQLSTVIDRSAAMIRQPSGCFEQVSSSTYPNLLVLQLIRNGQKNFPETEQNAMKFIEDGYQRLVKYETSENGFSLYGQVPANLFLTAYGLNEFTDMKKVYGGVDEQMLKRTRNFILSRKDGKGGFLHNKTGQDYINCLNTYTVWSLVNAGEAENIQDEILHTVKTAIETGDPYLLGISSNILFTINRTEEAIKLNEKIVALQAKDGSWNAKTTATYSSGNSLRIEATSVCLLALLNEFKKNSDAVNRGIQFISGKFSPYGFGNTQSTVLALKTLAKYAGVNPGIQNETEMELWVNQMKTGTYKISPMLSQPFTISGLEKYFNKNKNVVQVKFLSGEHLPVCYFETHSFCYQPDQHPEAPFVLTTTVAQKEIETGKSCAFPIRLKNISSVVQQNALIEYKTPQGFRYDPKQLRELKEKKFFADYEEQKGTLNFYINEVKPGEEIVIPLQLVATSPGKYHSPASKAYPYYSPEMMFWSDSESYAIK